MIADLASRRADAAAQRSQHIRAAADRPSKRRQFEAPTSLARVPASLKEVRITSVSSETVEFTGYASVTEHAYEMWDWYGPYDEIVRQGAFLRTLSRSDLDVPFVISHDQIRRIARTTTGDLQLSEDSNGLLVRAQLSLRDQDVQYIVPKLEAGHVDEMSFAFRIMKGIWSPDYTEYYIEEVDLHRGDVAIVGYGANPATAGSGLTSPSDADKDEERTSPVAAPLRPKRGVDLISDDDVAPRRAI